jgi:hypothetical protein
MKRLLVALTLVLLTAGTASAHGRFFFGINLGFPLFYPYAYPVYSYPVARSYYYPAEEVYSTGDGTRTVVEKVYVNGYLVEKRVKVYDNRYGNGDERRYEWRYDYDR